MFHSMWFAFSETQDWALWGDAQRRQGGLLGAVGPIVLFIRFQFFKTFFSTGISLFNKILQIYLMG